MGDESGRWKRIGWFVALWIGGVAAVFLTAFFLKLVMAGVAAQ